MAKLKSTHQSFIVLSKWIPVKTRRSRHVQKKLKVRKRKCPVLKNSVIHTILCPVEEYSVIHSVLCPVLKSSVIHLILPDPSRLPGRTLISQIYIIPQNEFSISLFSHLGALDPSQEEGEKVQTFEETEGEKTEVFSVQSSRA